MTTRSSPVSAPTGTAPILVRDPFLSGLLDREAGRVPYREGMGAALTEPDSQLRRELAAASRRFLDAKVPAADVACVAALTDLRFRVIDTNVQLERAWDPPPQPKCADGYEIAFATPADRSGVERVARKSFEFSRFHLDPQIPRETADRIKARWADNFFTGERGDAMAVARHGGEIAGFLQLIAAERTLVIDLIAVDPRHQRQRLASAMIAFAMAGLAGFDRVRVGTQVANTASLRLYEKLGFCACGAYYVLHRHS
jgi:ribosomal protein S18 acetylase RimI-like enzyme